MLEGTLKKLIKDHPHMMEVLHNISQGEKSIREKYPNQKGWPEPDWLTKNDIRILTGRKIIRAWMQERNYPKSPMKVFAVTDAPVLTRWLEITAVDNAPLDWSAPLEFDPKELFSDYILTGDSDRWEILEEIAESVQYPGEGLHILMLGPAASGKTVIMQAIMSLDVASFCSGGTTSAVGFAELVALKPKRIRIIDEVDKWLRTKSSRDAAEGVLLPLMEEGAITIHKSRKHFTVSERSLVICGANSLEGMSREFLGRFKGRIFEFPAYTREELIEIVEKQLTRKPWNFPLTLATQIAEAVWGFDKNPRTATGLASSAKIALLKGRDPVARVKSAIHRMKKFNPLMESSDSGFAEMEELA